MVTKSKKQNTREKERKGGKVKIDRLKLHKETVKDLADREKKQIQGGAIALSRVYQSC